MGIPATKSVLEQIYDWSQTRPLWLRDALRRVVQSNTLTDSDHEQVLRLCLQEKRIEPATDVAIPFDKSHFPATATTSSPISLTSISNVIGVNQLAPDETLVFSSTGVTVVYGDNGAGKSGYARILKRACRARSRGQPIERDVYNPSAPKVPTASIAYFDGASPDTVTWQDNGTGSSAVPELMAISVFDEDCASVHLNNENEVAFNPFGLDVPQKLAAVCQKLKISLQSRRSPFQSRSSFLDRPTWSASSKVGIALSKLTWEADLKEFTALSTLSDAEHTRCKDLEKAFSDNPVEAAKALRVVAARMKAVLQITDLSTHTVEAKTLETINSLRKHARETRAAAELAASKLFSDEKLPGVGSDVWRQLWEAARRYSESMAYPGKTFPVAEEDSKCVLCQQPLGDAGARLTSFEEFVKADIGKLAEQAKKDFGASVKTFKDARIRPSACREQLRDLQTRDKVLARTTRKYLLENAWFRREVLVAISKMDNLPSASTASSPSGELREAIKKVEAEAVQRDAAARDGARQLLETELSELKDRMTLGTLIPDVGQEILRLIRIFQYDSAIADANTTPITNLGNELAESTLTPQLRDRFAEELGLLANTRVRAELKKTRSERGKPMYRIQLIAAPTVDVGKILSEGEKKCVAIAGFLAEQATANHCSGLVFDDPVCSLDHRWRLKVAQRLVKLGASRQVIVFTHDIVFVHDLIDTAEKKGVSSKVNSLRRDSGGTGVVEDGLPWKGSRVEERINWLEQQARVAKSLFDSGKDEEYGRCVEEIYSKLRATWERSLEEVAFQRIVVRHRDYINAKDLKKVSVLTEQDCEDFHRGFKICCDITDSHDTSAGRNPEHPAPSDVLTHIKALSDWIGSLRDRQKSLI